MKISIHAPTRGATTHVVKLRRRVFDFNPRSYKRSDIGPIIDFGGISDFNPRSYKRSDNSSLKSDADTILFQSTLLQEERHFKLVTLVTTGYFNPRSYKRSDLMRLGFFFLLVYFNPRSYKRSDVRACYRIITKSQFQSTLLQEERPNGIGQLGFVYVFQSTLLQEERRNRACQRPRIKNFNPRSYKRSDASK